MGDLPTPGGSDVWGASLNSAIAGRLTPASPTYPMSGSALHGDWSLGGSYVSGDYTVADGLLEVTNGRAAGSYFYRACPAGDFTATMRACVTQPSAIGSPSMFGLIAVNNSGTGEGLGWYTDSSANSMLQGALTSAAYVGPFSNFDGYQGRQLAQGMWVWYRLRRVGTTLYLSLSTNGAGWSTETSRTNSTTFTRLGFGSFFGTVPKFIVDWFHVV